MENNYQLSRIHNYVSGLMSKEEMHTLEREALDDPFLQDAIDGYVLQNGVDAKQLSLLQKRFAARVDTKAIRTSQRFFSWQRLAIGAAAAVMFVAVCTLLLIRYFPQKPAVDLNEVMISEVFFEYDVTPNNNRNNVVPVQGWESLYDVLHTYSNSQHYEGVLHVTFELSADHHVVNLVVEGDGFQQDEELEDLLRKKMQWKGNVGDFVLRIHKIN